MTGGIVTTVCINQYITIHYLYFICKDNRDSCGSNFKIYCLKSIVRLETFQVMSFWLYVPLLLAVSCHDKGCP